MNPTKPIQHFRIPGLYSHADAIHSEIVQHLRLFQRDCGRVHLKGPFAQTGKIEALMQSGEKKFQLLHREGGRGATSKKNRLNPTTCDFSEPPVEIQKNRIEESLGLVAVGSLFIKAAVRTHLRTKGNVDVEMTQFRGLLNSVLDLHKHDYNPASCSELW